MQYIDLIIQGNQDEQFPQTPEWHEFKGVRSSSINTMIWKVLKVPSYVKNSPTNRSTALKILWVALGALVYRRTPATVAALIVDSFSRTQFSTWISSSRSFANSSTTFVAWTEIEFAMHHSQILLPSTRHHGSWHQLNSWHELLILYVKNIPLKK